MTVLVLGDAHADDPERRESLLAAYEAAAGGAEDEPRAHPAVEVALQAGDLGYYEPPIPTWFVAGNNEDFDVVDSLRRGDRSTPGGRPIGDDLHLLASTAVEVAGLRVAGLSGNFAPTKYEEPRSALSGDRRRHFVREDVERAMALEDVDVLVLHEAPTGVLDFGYDPGCTHVDDLVDALAPELCLVGHFHRHGEANRDGTQVLSLAPAWERYYTLDPETLTLEGHPTPAVESRTG